METSLSDKLNYLRACALAADDAEAFSVFRTNPDYTWVLEHVHKEQGIMYFERLRKHDFPMAVIEASIENDLYGGPFTIDVGLSKPISPTTLRYLNVALDLQVHLKDLSNLNVCEIGVGYGGQCNILGRMFNIAHYTLVDLPQVLALAKRYLECFPQRVKLDYLAMNELEDREYDLIISNYAFSEMTRPVQITYLDKIVKRSKNGYMIYNHISPPEYNSITANELCRIMNGTIFSEPVETHPDNRILVWIVPK